MYPKSYTFGSLSCYFPTLLEKRKKAAHERGTGGLCGTKATAPQRGYHPGRGLALAFIYLDKCAIVQKDNFFEIFPKINK